MDREPIITIKGLTNRYGEQLVHDHLDLTIDQGNIVAVIGNSGSGKTTLLRSILMLSRPDSGAIQVNGCNLYHCSAEKAEAIRRQWGVMFQSGALFSGMSVLENVMFPMQVFTHLSQKAMERIALFRIVLAGLKLESAYRLPSQLSGGMRKRAAMARAIALEPKLLFLDEPTAGLDPQSAESLDELVLYLKQHLGLTIVMITHDLDTLWHVTDRVVFLGEGTVLASGPVDEVAAHPHPLIKRYFGGYRAQRRAKHSA